MAANKTGKQESQKKRGKIGEWKWKQIKTGTW